MAIPTAKENIINKIRQALVNPVPLPFPQSEGSAPIYLPATEELEITFAHEFTKIQGKFVFCTDEADMEQQLHQLISSKEWSKIFCGEAPWKTQFSNSNNLESCQAAITGCEQLVARTGTIVLSAAQHMGRTSSVYAPVHICIAFSNQLVYDIKDALKAIKLKYAGNLPSLITFASGPSRTADIEKTLVTGVHGPKEVYLFLVDQVSNII